MQNRQLIHEIIKVLERIQRRVLHDQMEQLQGSLEDLLIISSKAGVLNFHFMAIYVVSLIYNVTNHHIQFI